MSVFLPSGEDLLLLCADPATQPTAVPHDCLPQALTASHLAARLGTTWLTCMSLYVLI